MTSRVQKVSKMYIGGRSCSPQGVEARRGCPAVGSTHSPDHPRRGQRSAQVYTPSTTPSSAAGDGHSFKTYYSDHILLRGAIPIHTRRVRSSLRRSVGGLKRSNASYNLLDLVCSSSGPTTAASSSVVEQSPPSDVGTTPTLRRHVGGLRRSNASCNLLDLVATGSKEKFNLEEAIKKLTSVHRNSPPPPQTITSAYSPVSTLRPLIQTAKRRRDTAARRSSSPWILCPSASSHPVVCSRSHHPFRTDICTSLLSTPWPQYLRTPLVQE